MFDNKMKVVGISAALATTLGLGVAPVAALAQGPTKPADANLIDVVRMYNPYTGEHLFSIDKTEVAKLEVLGWANEGTYWKAPALNDTNEAARFMPVYRLYNPYTSDHLYTTDIVEYTNLKAAGWNGEDAKFYSAAEATDQNNQDNKVKKAGVDAVGIYRQFNPFVTVGTHNYSGLEENARMIEAGWKADNVIDGKQMPSLYGYDLKAEQDEAYILSSITRLQNAYKAKYAEFKAIKEAVFADAKAGKLKIDDQNKLTAYTEKLDKIKSEVEYYMAQLGDVNKYVGNLKTAAQKKITDRINGNAEITDIVGKKYKDLKTASNEAKEALATENGKVKALKDAIDVAKEEIAKKNLEIAASKAIIAANGLKQDDAQVNVEVEKAKDAIKKAEAEIKAKETAIKENSDKLAVVNSKIAEAKEKLAAAKKAFRDFRYDQSLPLGQAFRDLVFAEDNAAQHNKLNAALSGLKEKITGYEAAVKKPVENYDKAMAAIKAHQSQDLTDEQKEKVKETIEALDKALVEALGELVDPQAQAEDFLEI